jgi:hypothetical protein
MKKGGKIIDFLEYKKNLEEYDKIEFLGESGFLYHSAQILNNHMEIIKDNTMPENDPPIAG